MQLSAITIFSALLFVSTNNFAIDTYKFGDIKSCRYDLITNEGAEWSDLIMTWKLKAAALNRAQGQDESQLTQASWFVYYSSTKTEDFATVGICRRLYNSDRDPIKFECQYDAFGEFPLAGGVFSLRHRRSFNHSPTYQCVQGCRQNVPSIIYYYAYEDNSSPELDLFHTRLERSCGQKRKKW
jgi:hypothetical protein